MAVDITMTGTLSNGGNAFPWGYASNSIPAQSPFYSVNGDAYVATFQFNTSVGSITSGPGPEYSLKGPATIANGEVTVTDPQYGAHTFAVPPCNESPCNTTTTAIYGRSSNEVLVLFYEDADADSGLALIANAITPWGASLTDPINTVSVMSAGIDIVLQPPNSYYDLVAVASVNTLSVAAIPEPSTWALLLAGFIGLGAIGLRARHAAAAIA
jgi:hypothetical protein